MIDIQKPGETGPDKNPNAAGRAPADPADVHAMKNLMHREGSAGELSALFSAQLSRRTPGKKELDRLPGKPSGESGPRVEPWDGDGGRGDSSASEETSDLAKEVAEHILVSDPKFLDPGSEGEVRIKIRERILKDAHVHLKRTLDHLKVRLVTTDPDSARILEAAEPALADRLKKNVTGNMDIRTIFLSRKDTHETP